MKQLILNPVENLPELITTIHPFYMHGFYVSDKCKDDEIVKNSIIGFSGRSNLNKHVLQIYNQWNLAMDSECCSMRLLSGLHAHMILFMGLGNIGDKVMILPVVAGGHYATPNIMKRLGYQVIEAIPDMNKQKVDFKATLELIEFERPSIIFIDRSEGLYYEDFTELLCNINYECVKVFDASQYLTNIIEHDFISPFEMGFDIIMSTLHKNFPGPQKAMVCSKKNDDAWKKIQKAMSDYVSSLHVENIFIAGNILNQQELLKKYSRDMLISSMTLERELHIRQVPVFIRDPNRIANHHLWIPFDDKEESFQFYKRMELCNLLVNYRKLPYQLGYGIRMGTAAATLQGLNKKNISILADFISYIYHHDAISEKFIKEVAEFINGLKPLKDEL